MADSAAAPRVHRVGDLVAGLQRLLDDRVGRLWVAGEISNLRRPASGHVYFTLKDADGQLRAALFRGTARRLPFEPEEGMEVVVYAEVTVYAPRGELQLVVRALEPRGAGALQLAFEQLRRRLEAEGLFEPDRKRALPRLPRRVGLVTSRSGAALRDVLEVSRRRLPSLPLLLAPCRVQGLGAEEEIADALATLDAVGGVDVILLVRGGGSLEDLQPFNTERVARAVAGCTTPVVCGVGHEVDVTIADLAADARAPTPSAAAELAIPDRRELAAGVAWRRARLERALRGRLAGWRASLAHHERVLRAHAPGRRVAAGRARWDAARRALVRAVRARLERGRARLERGAAGLDSLSPLAVLGRGYALVRREADGAIVREARDAPPGTRLAVRVARAELAAEVTSARPRDENSL